MTSIREAENRVIDAALAWRYAHLANLGQEQDAMIAFRMAVNELVYACPECNAGGHICPGCGASISHTSSMCQECAQDCLNRPDRAVKALTDKWKASELEESEPEQKIWVTRTWVDVRPGDTVRMPGSTHVDAARTVLFAHNQAWHVDPRTGTSSYNPPQSMEYSVIRTQFVGNPTVREMNPAADVDIHLFPSEIHAIELYGGWPERVSTHIEPSLADGNIPTWT